MKPNDPNPVIMNPAFRSKGDRLQAVTSPLTISPTLPTPESQTVPELPKKLKLTRVFVAFALVLAFVGLSVAGYVGYQKLIARPASTTLPPDESVATTPSILNETANWETYINPENGYSFKHPKDWFVYKNTDNSVTVWNSSAHDNLFEQTERGRIISYNDYALVEILIKPYGSNYNSGVLTLTTNIKDYYKELFSGVLYDPPIIVDAEDVKLSGQTAVQVSFRNMTTGNCVDQINNTCEDVQNGVVYDVATHAKNGLLILQYRYGNEYNNTAKSKQVFTQILSTFELIK